MRMTQKFKDVKSNCNPNPVYEERVERVFLKPDISHSKMIYGMSSSAGFLNIIKVILNIN